MIGTNPIECDERLVLSLCYLVTGEPFQSSSIQYKILFNAVSYVVKGYCKAIIERMASAFVKVPSTKAGWLNVLRNSEEKWDLPHTLEVIDGNISEFRSQRMVAPFIAATNTLIP